VISILHKREKKSNDHFNPCWPLIFNSIIKILDLREIFIYVRQFTWANGRDAPTFEKLDRVLASVEWKQKFMLVYVHALTRSGADHMPLLIDSAHHTHIGNSARFSLDLSWLRKDGFMRWFLLN
jgi:hypothetical protein